MVLALAQLVKRYSKVRLKRLLADMAVGILRARAGARSPAHDRGSDCHWIDTGDGDDVVNGAIAMIDREEPAEGASKAGIAPRVRTVLAGPLHGALRAPIPRRSMPRAPTAPRWPVRSCATAAGPARTALPQHAPSHDLRRALHTPELVVEGQSELIKRRERAKTTPADARRAPPSVPRRPSDPHLTTPSPYAKSRRSVKPRTGLSAPAAARGPPRCSSVAP